MIAYLVILFWIQAPAFAQISGPQKSAGGGHPPYFLQRLENLSVFVSNRVKAAAARIPAIPTQLSLAFERLTGGAGFAGFLKMLGVIFAMMAAVFGVELLFKRQTAGFYRQFESVPRLGEGQKFWSAALRVVTDLLGLFIFALSSLILFLLVYGGGRSGDRMIYIALLVALLGARTASTISSVLFSPDAERLRLIDLSDAAAGYLHRKLVLLAWIIVFGWVFSLVLSRLGVPREFCLLIIVSIGTAVFVLIAAMVWSNRRAISFSIIGGQSTGAGSGWLTEQFAAIWHILAFAYLFIIWLLWSGRIIVFQSGGGTFFASLLIVPIFLMADRLGQWGGSLVNGHGGGQRERFKSRRFKRCENRYSRKSLYANGPQNCKNLHLTGPGLLAALHLGAGPAFWRKNGPVDL